MEIDPVTLDIVDVSKRKRHRQRGRSTERSLFSPPSPAILSSACQSPSPPRLIHHHPQVRAPSILYNAIRPHTSLFFFSFLRFFSAVSASVSIRPS